MCGIAGIISINKNLVTQQQLHTMATALQHRGPDGEGVWMNNENTIGFAHRRLAIIDLSASAAQPMHYLHYTIIYNGEIYNYKELKTQLQEKGYRFTTQSDTEIIPAAFDCWGVECLHRFDGMFAFALYNNRSGEVIFARDRFGEKPLYYHASYAQRAKLEHVYFASEMKALWRVGIPKSLDGTMMLNYLAPGLLQHATKKTATFYSNILCLPPGHYVSVNIHEQRLQLKQWYRLPQLEEQNEKDVTLEFLQLFEESVSKRLRSDVNIGTSLSGGIDSSAVVAMINKVKGQATHWKNVCFTAGFPGFEKDETTFAKKVAEQFQLEQHLINPTADDWIKYFDLLMYHQEEPAQSSSVLTQFLVYRQAKRNNITVLLDGQGADEILGGYSRHVQWYLQQLFAGNNSDFSNEKKLLKQNGFLQNFGWRNYAAAYMPERTAAALQQKALREQNNAFVDDEFLHHYQNKDSLEKPVFKTLDAVLYYDTFSVGLQQLLRYADRNSMAHGTEIRLPFLSHQLVEYVFSLPSSYKIHQGYTKWLLREAMKNLLPQEIVWRKGKTGYEPPQEQWMQQPQVQEMITYAREKLVQEKVLNKKILQQSIEAKAAHDAGNYDWRYTCAAAMFNK